MSWKVRPLTIAIGHTSLVHEGASADLQVELALRNCVLRPFARSARAGISTPWQTLAMGKFLSKKYWVIRIKSGSSRIYSGSARPHLKKKDTSLNQIQQYHGKQSWLQLCLHSLVMVHRLYLVHDHRVGLLFGSGNDWFRYQLPVDDRKDIGYPAFPGISHNNKYFFSFSFLSSSSIFKSSSIRISED